jgi:hypothetical protein
MMHAVENDADVNSLYYCLIYFLSSVAKPPLVQILQARSAPAF